MSELIQNLTYIYNEKLLLKDAIGTESDDFMQYHTYVNALKPSGTSYITSNGDYDISSYSYVNVDVEGGGSSADPFYDYTTPSAMIANEEESADYAGSVISDNFNVTLDENDEVEAVEWDENITIDVEGTDVAKVVHVIVNGDPHDMLSIASSMESDFENYSDLYDNVYPILENATLTASEDPRGDGYDYLLEGDLYAWNMRDNFGTVEEITQNGFFTNNGALGFNVNVPSGEMSEGTYNIFNFLAYGSNNGMVELSNKAFEEINLYNLGPVNYIDPMDGTETKNQYVEMTLWDNPQMDTEVKFKNVTGDATSNNSDHWYQFNEILQQSEADEFMAVHIDVYDWASNIDPETGMDAGSWEVSDTYVAAFENAWNEPGDGAWTYTIRFYYDNNNSEWLVDLYQNGILVEEGVSAFAQQ